jgi:hypothetical protein
MIEVSKSHAMLPLRPRAASFKPLLKDPSVMKNYPKFYIDFFNPTLPTSPFARRDSAVESGRPTPVLKRLEAAPSRLSQQA